MFAPQQNRKEKKKEKQSPSTRTPTRGLSVKEGGSPAGPGSGWRGGRRVQGNTAISLVQSCCALFNLRSRFINCWSGNEFIFHTTTGLFQCFRQNGDWLELSDCLSLRTFFFLENTHTREHTHTLCYINLLQQMGVSKSFGFTDPSGKRVYRKSFRKAKAKLGRWLDIILLPVTFSQTSVFFCFVVASLARSQHCDVTN